MAGIATKCQIRYENEELCLALNCVLFSHGSHGYNQNVLGGPALVITMMRHHVLEAFFEYHTTKWKQTTSSRPRADKTQLFYNLSLQDSTYSTVTCLNSTSSSVASSLMSSVCPGATRRRATTGDDVSEPKDNCNRDTVNNNAFILGFVYQPDALSDYIHRGQTQQ